MGYLDCVVVPFKNWRQNKLHKVFSKRETILINLIKIDSFTINTMANASICWFDRILLVNSRMFIETSFIVLPDYWFFFWPFNYVVGGGVPTEGKGFIF